MAEVVQAVCTRLGWDCSVEVFPWRRALRMAESGAVDGIFSVLKNPEREAAFYVSEMVVETAYGFFVSERSSFFYRAPGDLEGFTVGVYGPSGTSAVLAEMLTPGLVKQVVVDIANVNVLKKLAAGRYGDEHRVVAAINLDVGRYLVANEGISGIRPAGDFKKVAYGIGLSRQKVSEAQFGEFNAALQELIRQGKVREILRRHGLKAAR